VGVRGPIPQSARQAWLKGSKRTARARAGQHPVVRLVMPADMTGDAAELWRTVVPRLTKAGVLTAVDVPALRDMCLCWQRIQECEREITRDGVTVEGYRGSRVKHPAVTIAGRYRESLARYFVKFGLEPMDRQRLPGPEEHEDAAQALRDALAVPSWPVASEDDLAEWMVQNDET